MKLRTCARALGVFLGMSLEVGFTAQVVQLAEETDVISAPAGCEVKIQECAVRIRDQRKKSILIDEVRRFVLGPSTNVFFRNDSHVRLLAGQIWIFGEDDTIEIETPMGVIFIKGEAWVKGDTEEVQVLNLGGKVRLRALGAAEEISVPRGMKNQMSGVQNGHAKVGIPQMGGATEVLSSIGPLFWGSRNQFRGWIEEHAEIWSGLEDSVASLHLNLAEREIASENERAERERAVARARAEERRKLRKMFFNKTFGVE
jgi:hypothetical protein